MWFNLHLKFKDPKALELVEKQFARGWYWAAGAEDSVREAGELSLIPLAAKYLSVDKPSEPMPPMGDVIYPGEPFIYAANAILGLLKGSYQTSEAIKKACYDQRMMYNNVPLFRRWWAANEDRCRKGDFAHLSSPLDYLKDQRKKP